METTPATEVSTPDTSPEDTLAAIFEKRYEGPAEQQAEDAEVTETQEEDSTEEDAEAQSDTDEESTDTEAEESAEEIEYEGKAYKLPKELKDALLRQQDYTRKTQEVAETRRQTEEKAKALEFREKFQQAHFAKAVEAQSLQSQLQQYAQVNWAELAESNPSQYLQLDRQHRQLQEAANRVTGEIQQLGQQYAQQMHQDKQRAQAKCIEELRKDFKDFGPELLKRLDDTGRSYGFTGEELADIVDPRVIRVLNDAAQYKKLQASKGLIEKKVKDAKPVQAKQARSANTSIANARLNDLRSKVKTSGRPADAEALLEARFLRNMR